MEITNEHIDGAKWLGTDISVNQIAQAGAYTWKC